MAKTRAKSRARAKDRRPPVGTIAWRDLTVKDADQVRDFYAQVVGWVATPVEMGGYSDWCMFSPSSKTLEAGVCHKRGLNADLPSQWLIYIVVADVKKAAAKVGRLGGKVVVKPRPLSGGLFCVVEDPAGAVCALYQPAL